MRFAIVLLCLLCTGPLIAEVSDSQIDAALATWRDYNMPEPPADAPLVVLEDTTTRMLDGEPMPSSLVPAFVLREPEHDQLGVYLLGTFEVENLRFSRTKLVPDELEMDRMISAYIGAPFAVNNWFSMALSCWARGKQGLARKLLAFAMKELPRTNGGVQPEFSTIEGWTGGTIWSHYANQLFEETTNRSELFKVLKRVTEEFDSLNQSQRELVSRLAATLQPSKAEPGTSEALIDALTELYAGRYWRSGGLAVEPSDNDLALLLCGFDAVPAMLDHANDERLTRSYSNPLYGGPVQLVSVGDVVVSVLAELACQRFDSDYDAKSGRWLYPVDRIRKWWETAKQTDEEQYLLDHLSGSSQLARVLGAKYPKALGKHFAALIEHPPDDLNYRLPMFLAGSKLPDAEKIRLLKLGANSESTRLRLPSLEHLKPLDHEAFASQLVKLLEALEPNDQTEWWGSRLVHSYAHLVFDTTDQRLWDALTLTTEQQNVDARMKILECVNHRHGAGENHNQRIAFAAHFLSDDAERWRANREYLPAQEWSMIRVGQFAAMQIGKLLKLRTEPEPAWSTERWNKFKAEVREVLEAKGMLPPDND